MVYPLSNIYKIWRGEGLAGPNNHANFQHCGYKNVALQRQNSNFWYKFAPKKKIQGVCRETLNIGAQLETFLYATVP